MNGRGCLIAVVTLGCIFAASACGNTDEDGWNQERICLSCHSTPRLAAPEALAFESVEVGGSTTETLELVNEGNDTLRIQDLELVEGTEDDLREFRTAGDWPAQPALPPGESIAFEITYTPKNGVSDTGTVRLETNDPREDYQLTEISLRGPEMAPRLVVNSSVAFSGVKPGSEQNRRMTILNEGQSALRIHKITRTGSEAFGVRRADGTPVSTLEGTALQPGESVEPVVSFEPEDDGPERGQLVLHTDDPNRPQATVDLIGKSVSADCPVAIAKAAVKGKDRQTDEVETVPLETVQFDGTASNDPDGEIERYEWSIIERPQGSAARLKPSSTVAKPELFLDRAGTYRVELTVYDDLGQSSDCRPPPVVEIEACPCGDLHVQLVWETPNDPDPADGQGANLDLHYLNPKGQWNASPYDIYWDNETADWGRQNDASDDPSLDGDDAEGGPENINHDGLERGKPYTVGVYYREDNDFGPSYATIRIYGDGQLKKEYKNKYLQPGQFWKVALIEWPMLEAYERDEVHEDFPESGQ